MFDFTIISYPGPRSQSLLSLTENRSRYMIPFGGRFRIIDFTMRNSRSSGAKNTIIYSDCEDDLAAYVNAYHDSEMDDSMTVVTGEFSDISFCHDLIRDSHSDYYVIYNGDSPSIIDFNEIIKKFKTRKREAQLFKLNVDKRPSMAYKVLVTNRKTLLRVLRDAVRSNRTSPNIFEMVINTLVNSGISTSNFNARYWPINNLPEYYELTRRTIWDPEIFDLLYREKIIESHIMAEGDAEVGRRASVVNSFVSDSCVIHGKVENSVLYPGVYIGEDTIIRDSILLPNVRIDRGARITRSIIDEGAVQAEWSGMCNIGNSCRIGSEEQNVKNDDYPGYLYSSITLIGKGSTIPEGSNIGAACYVASGLGQDYFSRKKYLYDGTSVIQ